ncbi:MAG: hypothetical protein HY800_05280, partial [Ignavibacteriales bacterium]|nr:hypothetical protein [Ignavibacteriales bacterium]
QPPRYTSYIEIDNDFQNLRSEGIAGLKVTCAHELHHAFQLGSYGYLSNDIYIYEITSTWMEDVLYDDINDYYQYIKTGDSSRGHFKYPDVAFTSNLSKVTYSRAIWGKFIEKRFSSEVMRQTWEFIRAGEKCLIAIDHSLTLYGSNFRKAFLEWALWNNNTGPSCDTIQYYSEGRQYPQIRLRTLVEYINTYRSFSDSIEALSSVYHPICLLDSPTDDCYASPQIMAIISNVNENGVNDVRYGFTYELSPTEVTGYTLLSNGIYIRLNAPDPENWVSQEDVPSIVSDIVVFPNPFYSGESKQLIFRFPPCSDIKATLYIFSSSMDKIISKDFDIISQGYEPKIIWDGADMHGRIIPTGIYFYVIAIDGKEYMGKFSVIRE